jgi:hypothetical protein
MCGYFLEKRELKKSNTQGTRHGNINMKPHRIQRKGIKWETRIFLIG